MITGSCSGTGRSEELSGIKAEDVVGTRQHWRAFYGSERPCMADLLVDESPETVPAGTPKSTSNPS